MYIYICIYICILACTYIYMHIGIYIHIYICIPGPTMWSKKSMVGHILGVEACEAFEDSG